MTTALALQNIDIWNDESTLKEIRLMVCPTPLTDVEFATLVGIGRATGLNPFLREIWAVKYRKLNKQTGKYEETPAQIFIGRDGYRKGAIRQPDYEYHQVNAIYSKDNFAISDDVIHHVHGFGERGNLLGAYCVIKRKSSAKSTYVIVSMDEYNLKQGLWNSKPETMIKKVAEAQALRQNFPDSLGGTYSDAEIPLKVIANKDDEMGIQTDRLTQILESKTVIQDAEIVNGNPVSSLAEQIIKLCEEKNFDAARITKALVWYKVDSLESLSDTQAQDFIRQLKKVE